MIASFFVCGAKETTGRMLLEIFAEHNKKIGH